MVGSLGQNIIAKVPLLLFALSESLQVCDMDTSVPASAGVLYLLLAPSLLIIALHSEFSPRGSNQFFCYFSAAVTLCYFISMSCSLYVSLCVFLYSYLSPYLADSLSLVGPLWLIHLTFSFIGRTGPCDGYGRVRKQGWS